MNTENSSVFNVYFSNFLVTRYRRDVIYSWKGLLGELQNMYARHNCHYIMCGFAIMPL
jgi:hypothetical protein